MNHNSRKVVFLIVLCLAIAAPVMAGAQEPQSPETKPRVHIDWQVGPTVGKLGDIAEIQIPEGFRFADKIGAQRVLTLTQNIPNGRELGVIVGDKSNWFMIFEFKDTGYVKDEEGSKLDNGGILKSIREGTEASNEQRAKRGWPAFHVNGWKTEPFYDPETHNLTWAILGRGDDPKDGSTVNHSIRILGRRGTMSVDLVASPEDYEGLTPQFNSLISGFHYTDGNRYSDFTKGDKVAEYGLTALIVGGAGAVALKTGLLAKLGILLVKLWKIVLVGIVALGAAIKRFFQKIFGKEERIENPNAQTMSQGQ